MRNPLSLPSSSAVLLLLAGTAACPGDDPDPTTIDVQGDRASLLAGREGSEPWEKLTADAAGDLEFDVTGPFELVGVCEDFGGEVYAAAGGPEDADIDPYAYDIGCGSVDVVAITVNNAGADDIYTSFGSYAVNIRAGATYELEVPSGSHDLFLVDRVNHAVAVRRAVDITAGMTIEVDLAGAVPLVEKAIDLAETSVVSSYVLTANGSRGNLAPSETSVWVLPPSLAASGDEHWMRVTDGDAELPRTRSRSVEIDPAASGTLSVQLPPHLPAATLSWNGLPSATFTAPAGEWTMQSLVGWSTDDDAAPLWWFAKYPHATATPGTLTAPDARTIAGWKPAWNVDAAAGFYLSFALGRTTSDGGRESVSWTLDTSVFAQKRAANAARLEEVRDRRAW